MAENIRIGIKGEADFTQLENAAKQTADRLARTLKGAAITGTFNPKEAHDFTAAIDSVNRALRATGQAGRAFSDIKFPVGQFAEAEKHLDRIKDRIEQMRQNSFGRAIVQRAGQFGLDPERPQDWTPDQFRRMYRDPRIAEMNWQRFMGPDYQQQGPGHQSGGIGQGLATGARFAAPRIMGSMGQGGQAAAMIARTAGSGAAAGGAALGATALAAGGAAVVGVGVVALIEQLKKGYGEHLQTLNAVDAQYKAIGSQDGFGGLMDRTRELGNALQMSQSEAAGLAQQFIKLSNESDSEQALQHAGYAGRFARAFGMQPAEGVSAFGRVQRAGIGESDAEMQKFALVLSKTIQGSGMDAQAGQVMEQMVGYLANIEASLGREASMTEAQGYSDMLRALYGPSGAMSSQAASNALTGISGLGSGKSPIDQALAMQAYGPELDWDFGKMKYFMEQPMTATPNSVFGEGGDQSRFEMIMEEARKSYPSTLSDDPRIGFGAAYNMMGHGSVTEGTHAYDMHQRLLQGLPAVDGSRDLSRTIADQKRTNDAEITNASADIAARISPSVEQFKALMADGLQGTEAFITQLEQGAKHFERLNTAIAEITGESVGDSLERLTPMTHLKAAGKAASVVGSAMVPPAGASSNPTPHAINPGALIGPSARTNPVQTPDPQPSASVNPVETPEPVPSADINPLALPDDLEIEDMSDPSFHYGKSASANAQPFEGIVFHHTRKDSKKDAEWYAEYGNRVDHGRGGAFGYHVYIDRDGQVIQGAPWDKRTNHVQPTKDVGLSNRNALGISLIGAEGGNETPEQMESARQVAELLTQKFGIDPTKVYGHGEIQGNRQRTEGVPAARMMRESVERQRQQSQQFMQQFGPDASSWLSAGAMLPREIQQQEQQRAETREQAISAAADVNVNINQSRADGSQYTHRYNLSVSEPRIAGSPGERQVWNHDFDA